MKIKNYEIKKIVTDLSSKESFMNTNSNELPISLLWDISNNFDKLLSLSEKIDKMVEDIQNQFSSDEFSEPAIENGKEIGRRIKMEYEKDFSEKIDALMKIENEIDINMVNINSINNLSLSGKDFQSIKFMITK